MMFHVKLLRPVVRTPSVPALPPGDRWLMRGDDVLETTDDLTKAMSFKTAQAAWLDPTVRQAALWYEFDVVRV